MTKPKDMIRNTPTGIDVIIVGGGIGGMACAIECHRKGHNVRIYERRQTFETFGDLIGIGRSAQTAMLHWPGFFPRLTSDAMPSQLSFYKYDGTKLVTLKDRETKTGLSGLPIWRVKLHTELYKYAEELGIPITYNKRAISYFETDTQGGVVFQDGEKVMGDLIVAADGIGSPAMNLIVKDPEVLTSSGYAIFRASMPLDHALKDPLVNEHLGGDWEGVKIFLNENIHIVTAKSIKSNKKCWMMTHKDPKGAANESWSADCPATDALPFVPVSEGWAPYMPALIKQTPGNKCVNWKLVWRSPQPVWSTPKHRILQLGDSCHPFIPTSGSGAVMAMGDGYSLATCSALAGKEDIPLGVRVHNKLRFEHVAFAQRMGFDTREVYHHPSWENIANNSMVWGVGGAWVFDHDAEKYALRNFDKCADQILNGADFKNTNTPEGETYAPWTIQGLLDEARRNDGEISARL